MSSPVIDPASLTWDGPHQCWVWSSPTGPRYYHPHFGMEYDRAEEPRKAKPSRYWPISATRLELTNALRAAATVVAARHEELESARRAIQVRRQAEHLEGVVTVMECANCGAPPPGRGQPCRFCGTIAAG